MTDFSRWDELIQVIKFRERDIISGTWQFWDGKEQGQPIFSEYITVPLNEYQIGNLLGALARAENTGDWYDEVIAILGVAMDKAGIKELANNSNDLFTVEDVLAGNLKVKDEDEDE